MKFKSTVLVFGLLILAVMCLAAFTCGTQDKQAARSGSSGDDSDDDTVSDDDSQSDDDVSDDDASDDDSADDDIADDDSADDDSADDDVADDDSADDDCQDQYEPNDTNPGLFIGIITDLHDYGLQATIDVPTDVDKYYFQANDTLIAGLHLEVKLQALPQGVNYDLDLLKCTDQTCSSSSLIGSSSNPGNADEDISWDDGFWVDASGYYQIVVWSPDDTCSCIVYTLTVMDHTP